MMHHRRTRPRARATPTRTPPRAASTTWPAATGTRSSPATTDRGQNEQIVVNMGPQHPSTHGVLRLVLDAGGRDRHRRPRVDRLPAHRHREEPGVPHLDAGHHVRHPGRLPDAAVQRDGVLPVRRAAARHRGQAARAGQADPGAAAGAEPDRLAPGRHRPVRPGARRDHDLPAGRPERENVLDLFELITGLRMNHAFIRPGGVAQDLPAGGIEAIRDFLRKAPRLDARPAHADRREPGVQGADQGHRLPRPRGLHGARRDRADAARHRAALGPAQVAAVPAATRPTSSTSRPSTPATPTAGTWSGWHEIEQSLRIIEQCLDRLADRQRAERPVDDPGREDRLAGPAVARPGRHGPVARAHRAHHGPVHGGAHPPLQAGDRGLPGAGRARRTCRSSRPRASSAATWSATAAPGRTGRTCATPRSTTCRPSPCCAKAATSRT